MSRFSTEAMNGLSFSRSIMGVQAQTDRFKSHTQNLASAGAVAGKNFEVFLTAFETSRAVSGVDTTTLRHLKEIGNPIESRIASHMAVSGQGWFPVRNKIGENQSPLGLTRDGTFDVDKDLYFRNARGEYLQVLYLDQEGNIMGSSSDPSSLKPLNLGDFIHGAPSPTKDLQTRVQLPGLAENGTQHPQIVTVFDSLGNQKNVNLSWAKTEGPYTHPDATQGWVLSADINGGTIDGPYATGSRIEFNHQGQPLLFDAQGGGAQSIKAPALNILWADASAPSGINLNLGEAGTNNGIMSVGDVFEIRSLSKDGSAAGELVNFHFNEKGEGYACYENKPESVKICRMLLGQTNNINGLSEIRPGVFSPNHRSGDLILSFPQEGGTGGIISGHYEGSKVESTTIFTNMIEDQKRFMGNLKAIQTLEDMIDALIERT